MKQLATLIRLQKREMDELRQRLVQQEGRRDHYIAQIEQLSDELQQEYNLAQELPDMRGFFGDFSGSIKKRQQQLAANVVRLETEIQKLNQEIFAQFTELKKFEIAKEQFDAAEAREAKRKEQMEMDEIGIRNAVFFEQN